MLLHVNTRTARHWRHNRVIICLHLCIMSKYGFRRPGVLLCKMFGGMKHGSRNGYENKSECSLSTNRLDMFVSGSSKEESFPDSSMEKRQWKINPKSWNILANELVRVYNCNVKIILNVMIRIRKATEYQRQFPIFKTCEAKISLRMLFCDVCRCKQVCHPT